MEALLRALKAAGEPNRLRLLRALRSGPMNVAELTQILGVGQSTVSRHLRLLADAELVEVRRTGTWAFYSLPGAAAAASTELPARLLAFLAEGPGEAANPDGRRIEEVLQERRRATSAFFRNTAHEWDQVRAATLGPLVDTEGLLETLPAGGTVVDLGTGTGVLLKSLEQRATRVIGIDASAEMLAQARRRIEAHDLQRTELRLGQLEHLPLCDGEADVMLANLVLHHVADVPGALRDMRRALAPHGHLLIADLQEGQNEEIWNELGARWPGFRPDELKDWLSAAGFEAVHWRVEDAPPRPDGNHRPTMFLMEAKRAEQVPTPTQGARS